MATTDLTLEDPELQVIFKHNREIVAQREALQALLDALPALRAPCAWCPLDGEFRCSACHDADFAGFNDRDWY